MRCSQTASRRSQAGAAAVEFAIVAMLFFMILLGAIEMSRLMWTWNAAGEATRLGARLAVVCDINDTAIVRRMRQMLPYLEASHVNVAYLPGGCSASTCDSVRVTLAGYTHRPIIPLAALAIAIPPFQTTLPKEFMQSSGNPVCA